MRLSNDTFNYREKVYATGILHFVLLCFGIWSLIQEMINLEEPVTTYEEIYIGLHYTVHLILILCLMIGAYRDIPYFMFPWIFATFIPLSALTMLNIHNLGDYENINGWECLFNFVYVVVCWYCWWVVCYYFMDSHNRNKIKYKKIES